MRAAFLCPIALVAVSPVLAACEGGPPPPPPVLDRFNPSMCPKIAPDRGTLPLDPAIEGVKANVSLVSHRVVSANFVRVSLTFTNGGQHGTTLALPRQAFSIEGYHLVDRNCVPVPYRPPTTPRALNFDTTGPMPLNQGESATLDLALDDMAPGLVLPPGTYALRLALRMDPKSHVVRGRTIYSEWTVFVVGAPAA